MITELNFNAKDIPLHIRVKIGNLQLASWKVQEAIDLSGVKEGSELHTYLRHAIGTFEMQIEELYGN
jgi:hypothetical protein